LSDQNTAAGFTRAESQEATFVWRTVWWLAIWDSVHEDLRRTIWGYGYGFPLGDLVPYLEGQFIRTPHNEFLYALGYTGWVGVALFFLFEGEILRLLWKVNRATGEPFGVAYWATMMTFGMFFPLGETPYGAIPFYLITGWVVAPIAFGEQPAQHQNNLARKAYLSGAGASRPAIASP
jgi:O-antigen ligase